MTQLAAPPSPTGQTSTPTTSAPTSAPTAPAAPAALPAVTARPPARRIGAVVVSTAASLLALLDTSIVNVSLHATSARFGSLTQIQWVVTGYLLALAATMPATGWLVGRFGLRRSFVAAAAVFVAGSAACTFAPSLAVLITGRVVAGAAAGILTPAATILLTRGVPREQLGRVQALNGSVMLIGPLIGPTVGGLLIHAAGWPAIYAINIPFGIAIIVGALLFIPAESITGPRHRLDLLGLVAIAVGTTSAVLLITAIGSQDQVPAWHLGATAAGLVLGLAVFVRRELTTAQPLLDLRLYANQIYRLASINIFLLGFILYGPMVIIPLYFQAARGNSVIITGLLLSTAGFGVVISGIAGTRILTRIGGGATMIIGISLTLIATVPLTRMTGDTSYLLLCGSLVVRGAGIGLTIVPAMTRAFQSIPAESIKDASPQLNLLQRIGGAMAAALITVVLQHQAELVGGLRPVAFAHSCLWVLGTSALTLVPAVALAVAERRKSTS